MKLPEFLVETDGDIRLCGHRIGLYHVVCCYKNGYSAEMVVCEYPTLPLSLVYKVFAFYLENRDSVDAYVAEYDKQMDELVERLPRLDVVELRRRMEAIQRAEAAAKS